MNSYRNPHHSVLDGRDFIFVCTDGMQRRRRRTHEFDSTHNIRYVLGNRPGGRGAQGAAVDASTYDRGPREQLREQAESEVMGTLEKSTAEPVLKGSRKSKSLEGRVWNRRSRIESRESRVESRESRVESRGWRVEGGGWRVEGEADLFGRRAGRKAVTKEASSAAPELTWTLVRVGARMSNPGNSKTSEWNEIHSGFPSSTSSLLPSRLIGPMPLAGQATISSDVRTNCANSEKQREQVVRTPRQKHSYCCVAPAWAPQAYPLEL